MSKYVYFNGTIRKVIEYQNRVEVIIDTSTVSLPKPEFNHIYSNAKIVDDLTEIIEVGDLVAIHTPSLCGYELMFVKDLHLDKTLFTNNKSYSNKNIEYIEIWKRINNTFVRMCHKENDKWVVDYD